jgi:hypothetical protein
MGVVVVIPATIVPRCGDDAEVVKCVRNGKESPVTKSSYVQFTKGER